MSFRSLRLFVCSLIFVASSGLSQAQTMTIVADEWPPFSGASLPNKGMSLDVISTVLTKAGYDVETEVLPWARIMNNAKLGKVDIVGSLFFDADLTQHLSYAEPFYQTDVQLVRRKGTDHAYTSVEALKPYSIAVGAGFLYQDEFDRADYLNKIVVTETLQAAQMVAAGRADLTLDSVDVINHVIYTDAPELASQLEVAPGVLASQGIYMAVRNSLPNRDSVIRDFNRVLQSMRDDGSLERLLAVHTRQ